MMHTYSIVARDPRTGQLGVAVQSHYFSVGSVVPWAEAGVGAVATQSFLKVDYGPDGLSLMRQGLSATQALTALLENDDGREVRQVAMVDAQGTVAVHTGSRCIPAAGHLSGDGFSVQANLMVDASVWPAMHAAYETASGELVDRLIVALEAGQAVGGDIRGQQSAAVRIVVGERQVKPGQGCLFDLRVEDHPEPIGELKRLVRLRRAYRLADQGDEFVAVSQFDAALAAYAGAAELAPEIVELRFWQAVTLFQIGKEVEALETFREVFRKEPIWADLVPRLVPLGILPDDPGALQRIVDQRMAG
jgi:uncharacterized Ntn-hydrolase superfamily protein